MGLNTLQLILFKQISFKSSITKRPKASNPSHHSRPCVSIQIVDKLSRVRTKCCLLPPMERNYRMTANLPPPITSLRSPNQGISDDPLFSAVPAPSDDTIALLVEKCDKKVVFTKFFSAPPGVFVPCERLSQPSLTFSRVPTLSG